MVVRYESIRSALGFPSLQELGQNGFGIPEQGAECKVKGLKRCQLFALGAILLYQIVLLYQHQRQQPVGVGIKALLRAA
jgi:hypothetical protein